MIYLSDDYLDKYIATMSYLIGRSYSEGYSFDYIEKMISSSPLIHEFENSNVTTIAFTSIEKNYVSIFHSLTNNYTYSSYDIYGWLGYAYIHLFLSLEITFESLFILIPLKEMMGLYKLYHEIDINRLIEHAKELIKYSLLDVIMKKRKVSNIELSKKTNIPESTIRSLRYGLRNINELGTFKTLLISRVLDVKIESLLLNINLVKQ